MYRTWLSPRAHGADFDWLPSELRDAELVWSEKLLESSGPVHLVARIDRAYRKPDGELVLVEFKRRAGRHLRLSDVVELSVQRYVLQKCGQTVSARGYVVVIFPDGTRCRAIPAELEDWLQVRRRADRLVALREEGASPHGPAHPAVCESCGHRDVCRYASS